MSLTQPVTFRLSAEKHFIYETEATYKGQALGIYLRERLEKEDTYFQAIQELHQKFSTFPVPSFSNISSFPSLKQQGLWVEILLLLRFLSNPEKLLWVQKELKRLNLPLWEGEVITEKLNYAE